MMGILTPSKILKQAWHFFMRNLLCIFECGGAGEIRTPVQTSNTTAFYMFSFCLIFDVYLTKNCLIHT